MKKITIFMKAILMICLFNTTAYHANACDTGNLVSNGDFETGTSPWQLYVNTANGASATLSREGEPGFDGLAARVSKGTGEYKDSDVQFYVSLGTLQSGKTYEVVFTAKAFYYKSLRLGVLQNVSPWKNYLSQSMIISPEAQTYAVEFTMSESSSNSRLDFFIGGGNSFDLWLDNVIVREKCSEFTPAIPVLSGSSTSSNSVNLIWVDNSSDEEGFTIEMREGSGDFVTISSLGANVTSYYKNGLQPGTGYDFRMRAYNDYGFSTYSNIVSITTQSEFLLSPVNLHTTIVSDQLVSLAWLSSEQTEDGYKIERKIGNAVFAEVGTSGVDQHSFVDIALTPGTTYTYRVRAYRADAHSEYSQELTVTTQLTNLGGAPNLYGSAASHSQINLSWTDQTNQEDGFVVEKKLVGGEFMALALTGENQNTYSDTGLNASTTYVYRVKAYNDLGESAYSNEYAVTTGDEPVLNLGGCAESDVAVGETFGLYNLVQHIPGTQYFSTNATVATVTSQGVVTAVGEGNANIEITTPGGQRAFCYMTVVAPVLEVGGCAEAPVAVGESFSLYQIANPSTPGIQYASLNTNVATVDGQGVVTAISEGSTSIVIASSSQTVSCDLTVIDACSNPSIAIDGTFDSGLQAWQFYVNGGSSASASVQTSYVSSEDSNMANITVASAGTKDSDIQFYSNLGVLSAGKTYEVVFKAKATGISNIRVGVLKNSSPWTNYLSEQVAVSTNVEEYSVLFSMSQNVSNARVDFFIGKEQGELWLDDVIVREACGSAARLVDAVSQENGVSLQALDMSVYPNPLHSYNSLTIQLDASAYKLQVMNLNGAVIYTENVNQFGNTHEIQIEAKPGVYLVRAFVGNHVSTKRLIIQ